MRVLVDLFTDSNESTKHYLYRLLQHSLSYFQSIEGVIMPGSFVPNVYWI